MVAAGVAVDDVAVDDWRNGIGAPGLGFSPVQDRPAAPPQTPRDPTRGMPPHRRMRGIIGLSILTFGLYQFYFNWAPFREVDRDAGRPHAAWLYVLSVLLGLIALFLVLQQGVATAQAQTSASPSFEAPSSTQVLPFQEAAHPEPFFAIDVPRLVAVAAGLLMSAYQAIELGNLATARAAIGGLRPSPRLSWPILNGLFCSTFLLAPTPRLVAGLLLLLPVLFALASVNDAINGYWSARRLTVRAATPLAQPTA